MATVETKYVDPMDALDLLSSEDYETPKQKMTEDELRSLHTVHVDYAPEAEYLGRFSAPYHDVDVYRGTDGKYYSVWYNIGD